jgi:hypothetical protein
VQQGGGLQATKRPVSLLSPCKNANAGYQARPIFFLLVYPINPGIYKAHEKLIYLQGTHQSDLIRDVNRPDNNLFISFIILFWWIRSRANNNRV